VRIVQVITVFPNQPLAKLADLNLTASNPLADEFRDLLEQARETAIGWLPLTKRILVRITDQWMTIRSSRTAKRSRLRCAISNGNAGIAKFGSLIQHPAGPQRTDQTDRDWQSGPVLTVIGNMKRTCGRFSLQHILHNQYSYCV